MNSVSETMSAVFKLPLFKLLGLVGINGAVILCLMAGLWLLSLRRNSINFVVVFWGLGFVVIAWMSLILGRGDLWRGLTIAVLVSLWGARLIWRMSQSTPRQTRHQQIGADAGRTVLGGNPIPQFQWQSLYVAFGLQAILVLSVSIPIQASALLPTGSPPGWPVALGVALFLAGYGLELLADQQLAAFRKDPLSNTKVLNEGVWSWTRHPNYFGDACVWWGIFAIAMADISMVWTAAGPCLITYFMIRASELSIAEQVLVETIPSYKRYVGRTSAFFPWPPKDGPTQEAS